MPLQLVAKIEETDGPNQILRENGQRRIAVYANSDGTRDRAQIIADIRDVLAGTPWPQGYSATLEGTYQAYEEAAARIGVLSLASLALIFLVLQSRYRSAVLALIIMVSVPLALIGSVAALWIAGLPLSVASMMGFVTLAGISTRNGILKISRYINLALHEGERVRARTRHPRQPRAARARAAHRPVGGARADAASRRRRRAGPRNPPSGGRDHLRRSC